MSHGTLYQRLLAVALLAMVPVFLLHLAVQIASDFGAARARAQSLAQDIAAATVPLLQNMLIVGDLATAQEAIDNIMHHGQFRTLVLVDAASALPLATGRTAGRDSGVAVPAWFSSLLDVRFESRRFPVQAGGETYATLVVEPSAEGLVADVWQRLWTAAILWLATAASLLLLLRHTLRRGLQPLRDLAEAANRFGSGDLACRAPSCDVPELAATAMAFNRMAENLAEAQEHLEIRVQDRTAALAAREAHTSAILRNLHDGVIQVDANRCIVTANTAACRLFGYREGELVGRNLVQLIPAAIGVDWSGAAIDTPDAAGDRAGGRRLELWGRRKDGSGFDVEIARDRLSLAGEESCIAVLRNISEQKAVAAEREAARLNAEALARAKSEFLANMSHEIRTPLNAILGFAQVGQRKYADPEVQRMLGHILQSGELLLRIINDILDFSKLEVQKLLIESIAFNLPDVVNHAANAIAPAARHKGLEFIVELSRDLPPDCRGDPVRVAQILMNLLANAVKFTESGQVRLEVTSAEGMIRFRIRDTGIGMQPETLQRLFQPFEQADASISRRFGGTGLGLAISRRLARQMGGSIDIDSQPGLGTLVEVQLPLGCAQPAGAAAPDPVAIDADNSRLGQPPLGLRVPAQTPPRLAGLRILAVEDDAANRLVLREMLELEGAAVDVFEQGVAACAHLKSTGAKAFDLVVTDLQMPGMDGFATARAIRRLAPALPVVGLSAHTRPEERAQCLAAGMLELLPKPVSVAALVSTLVQIRGPSPAGTGTTAPTAPARGDGGAVDWPALEQRFGGNSVFVDQLAGAFLESARQTSAELAQAIGLPDLATLATLSHRTAGMAANLSLDGLADLARETERMARSASPQSLASAREMLAGLEAAVVSLRIRLGEQDQPADSCAWP